MPVGKGRTLLRCSIRTDLYEALSEEAREKELDLGSVVEGHLEHSRMLSRAEHQLIERRLDTLSHGQEQMLRLLESLVTRLEQGPMTHDVSSDEDMPPVATYDQSPRMTKCMGPWRHPRMHPASRRTMALNRSCT
jgi:hypothetical protein